MQQEQLLQTQGFTLDQIKEQRDQLLLRLDQRESELLRIEKFLESSNKRQQNQNQFEDLQDGILMCKEKCVLLQEENIEFTKMAHCLKQQNDQLKSRYSIVRQMYDNNLSTLNELQQHGLNINYRMMKQIKIIKDLGQLNQNVMNQSRKSKLEKYVSNYSQLEDTQQNIDCEVVESISQLISIKRELAQINMNDNSLNSPRQQDIQIIDPILTSGTFRFKTHHNLGEKQIRQRQISQQIDDLRAFSELNEDDEVKQQSSDEDHKHSEQMSNKQPWYFKSAVPNISSKNSEKKWENYSEKKKHHKNKYSFASASSNESFNRMGVMTLKEEFQSIYQRQQLDEDIKEKDTEMNDSDEIPQLIQQESILEDSTIIINRKSQQLSKSIVQIEKIQEPVKSDPYKNIKIAGVLLATCGIAGWLYKKYF
ncbi:unnamed protein product [Paramecium pentaurelia]|uniref:Uncharacterized protein n=1 Tax=Paramecium pentaurelia TaxID=43138 RepID=A0A8S1Y5R1_9CILI|nr:unnamed protein product [Paramecium pentaurelia]